MKTIKINISYSKITFTGLAVCLLITFPAFGQSIGDYELNWSAIDGGGGTSEGGDYTLIGTIGQPDIGSMTGGGYKLVGGFWPSESPCYVDLPTLADFAAHWLQTGENIPGDLNHDLKVDLVDFSTFASYWLKYCPDSWYWW